MCKTEGDSFTKTSRDHHLGRMTKGKLLDRGGQLIAGFDLEKLVASELV
jgi:hypothetical protein